MKPRRTGATLIVVILLVSMVAVGVVLLAGLSDDVAFQSRQMYNDACQRNLAASAAAWARAHPDRLRAITPATPLALPADELKIPDATLTLLKTTRKDAPVLTVHTACRSGRSTLHASRLLAPPVQPATQDPQQATHRP